MADDAGRDFAEVPGIDVGAAGAVAGCPDPGIYPGVPFSEYAAWDAMNASTLCEGLVSMRRLKAKLDGKLDSADSDAMRFGRAVHCRLLEPERFPTAFPQSEQCVANLKGAKGAEPKRCRSRGRYMSPEGWKCGTHAEADDYEPSDYITADEAERIEAIRRNALGDKATGQRGHEDVMWMAGRGVSEPSIVFDLYGVRCKARLDKWIPESSVIVDVKTIGRPFSEHLWLRTTLDLRYDFKAAFYIEAVKSLGFSDPGFAWVFIETAEPYDVAVVELTPDVASAGRFDVQKTLASYKACLESGEWPGQFPRMVSHFTFPKWKLNEYAGQEIE